MDFHPLIVHFPIVCIILAAGFDWAAHTTRFGDLHRAGLILLLLGALTAIPAAYTGESAAETAQAIPDIDEALEHHEDLSTAALWSAILLGISRIHLVARKRYAGARKLVHMLLVTGCAAVVCWSAYTGGSLVYEFGAGTKAATTKTERAR